METFFVLFGFLKNKTNYILELWEFYLYLDHHRKEI